MTKKSGVFFVCIFIVFFIFAFLKVYTFNVQTYGYAVYGHLNYLINSGASLPFNPAGVFNAPDLKSFPAVYFLAFFARFFDSVYFIVFIKSLFLALCIFPVYKLTNIFLERSPALFLTVIYVFASNFFLALYGFSMYALGLFFIYCALYYYSKDSFFYVFYFLIACLFGEIIIYLILIFLIAGLFVRNDKKTYFCVIIIFLYFISFTPYDYYFWESAGVLSRKEAFFSLFSFSEFLSFLSVSMLLPLLFFLAALGGAMVFNHYFLCFLPFIYFLALRFDFKLNNHFIAPLIPFLFYGVCFSFVRIKNYKLRKKAAYLSVVLIIITFYFNASGLSVTASISEKDDSAFMRAALLRKEMFLKSENFEEYSAAVKAVNSMEESRSVFAPVSITPFIYKRRGLIVHTPSPQSYENIQASVILLDLQPRYLKDMPLPERLEEEMRLKRILIDLNKTCVTEYLSKSIAVLVR